MNKRIIIGISGASGFIYGVRLLELLQDTPYETHLVVSKAAQQTRSIESHLSAKEVYALADYHYPVDDISAPIASGSYPVMGMIIAPCSMSTLANVAMGNSNNLLTRAADVTLKERRPLILMARETPLHLTHLDNMMKLSQMGAIIAPPVPAFYNQPANIDDLVNHSVGRVLDLFDIDLKIVKRWK